MPLVVALAPGVTAAFTTRADGDVVTDPDGVVARLGLDPAAVAWCEQVHGNAVARAEPGRRVPGADALVTGDNGVALAVRAADCVPLLLAGPGGVAAVHAGRRGLVAGVVQNAVAALGDVTAAVAGPAIGPCCYEVGEDVATEVAAVLPATRATTRQGRPSLDLLAGVRAVLGDVPLSQAGGCTVDHAEEFFSYRREATAARHAGIVWRS